MLTAYAASPLSASVCARQIETTFNLSTDGSMQPHERRLPPGWKSAVSISWTHRRGAIQFPHGWQPADLTGGNADPAESTLREPNWEKEKMPRPSPGTTREISAVCIDAVSASAVLLKDGRCSAASDWCGRKMLRQGGSDVS